MARRSAVSRNIYGLTSGQGHCTLIIIIKCNLLVRVLPIIWGLQRSASAVAYVARAPFSHKIQPKPWEFQRVIFHVFSANYIIRSQLLTDPFLSLLTHFQTLQLTFTSRALLWSAPLQDASQRSASISSVFLRSPSRSCSRRRCRRRRGGFLYIYRRVIHIISCREAYLHSKLLHPQPFPFPGALLVHSFPACSSQVH